MSLDVLLEQLVEIPGSVSSEEDLNLFCETNHLEWNVVRGFMHGVPTRFVRHIPLEEYDWDLAFSERSLNLKDWEWTSEELDFIEFTRIGSVIYKPEAVECPDGSVETVEMPQNPGERIRFQIDQIPMKLVEKPVFAVKEDPISHQRRGVNKRFHEDGKWTEDTIVSSKEELLHDWKNYFSDTEEGKENFRKNFVDKFVEGETIVVYC